MAKQELEQKVCQRYGWGAKFHVDEQNFWSVSVSVGFNDCRHFVSDSVSPKTKAGVKQGKEAAAAAALAGLQEDIRKEEAKPEQDLREIFHQYYPLPVYQSDVETWQYFWNNCPNVVGIDTEGNQQTPPVLVQIAMEDYVILEVPTQQRLSGDLQRLLADDSIVKVFCDNQSHRDKKSLGLQVPDDLTKGPIVDLEALVSEMLGPCNVARGLARITCLAMPELNVRIRKPGNARDRLANVGRYSLIEQGRAPQLNSIYDLTHEEQQYAALDAWCTLYTYRRLQQYASST